MEERVRIYDTAVGKYGTVSKRFVDGKRFVPAPQGSVSQPQAPAQQGGFLERLITSLASPFVRTGQRVVGAGQEISRAGEVNQAEDLIKEANRRIMAGDTSPQVKAMLDQAQAMASNASKNTIANRDTKIADPLQIAKDSAAMLSWGVPVGGASKVLGGPLKGVGSFLPGIAGKATTKIGGRALAGAAGGFGYSPETSLGGLIGSTALGAGASVGTGAVLDKLFPGKVPTKETVTDIVPEEQVGKVSVGTKMQQAAKVKMIGQKGLANNGGIKLVDDLDEAGIQIGKNVKNADQLFKSSTELLSQSSDEIQSGLQELSQKGVKVDTSKVFDAVDDWVSKQGSFKTKQAAEIVRKDMIKSFGGERVSVDPYLFYKYKYNAGGNGKWGLFTGLNGDEASVWNKVHGVMNQQLDDTLKQIGVDTLRQSNKNISTAMKGMDWASKANEAVPQSPWTFYDTVSLGTGLTYGGLPGAVGNITLNKILTDPRGQYAFGGLLNKVQGQGAAQAGQVAQTPIRDALSAVLSKTPAALPGAMTQTGRQPEVSQPTIGVGTQPMGGMETSQPTDILSILGLDEQGLRLLMALPVKEQNAILIDLIGEKVKGGGMSADNQKAIQKLDTTLTTVNQLENEFSKLNKSESGIAARVGGLARGIGAATGIDQDPALRNYDSMRKGVRSLIAKTFGEVGNLSEPEQENAIRLIPSIYDSAEEAAYKFNQLKTLINSVKSGYLQ